jgi:hypothetical protein
MKYRDQFVQLYEIEDLIVDETFNNAIESTVLFWNLSHLIDEDEFKFFVDQISNYYPLNIAVAGREVEDLFDCLLKVLGFKFENDDPEDKHIMTWKVDGENTDDIIEEFFNITTLSLWRFDNWNYYKVYLYGNKEITSKIKEKILLWLSMQKPW